MLCQAYSRRDETIASALRLGVAEGKEQITAIKSTTHEMPELLQQIVGLLEK